VRRVRLAAGAALPLALEECYALLIVISGVADLGGPTVAGDEAVLLPRGWRGVITPARESRKATFLLVLPRA